MDFRSRCPCQCHIITFIVMDAHPTDHPLQPHQVGLLVIFILTFKDLPTKNFDSEFLLYLLRMLLDEVSEVHLDIMPPISVLLC